MSVKNSRGFVKRDFSLNGASRVNLKKKQSYYKILEDFSQVSHQRQEITKRRSIASDIL